MSELIELPEADAPTVDAPNRIVINFPDDHDIGGMKIELIGVTSEQIAVAVYHIMRAANQLSDAKMMHAEMQRREIESVRREIMKGH